MVAVVLLTGCGADAGDDAEAYLATANAIQREAAPELQRANRLYAKYVRGGVALSKGTGELERAEASIRSLRARLARIRPPADARRLHRLILLYYTRGAALAHETTVLGTYLPAAALALRPLERINRRFRRELLRATGPAHQAAALARYERGLRGVVRRLRPLDAPAVLRAAHVAQVERLTAARTLAGSLGRAVERRDAQRVARLLLRFRRLTATPAPPTLGRRSVHAYNRRFDRLKSTAAAVEREQRTLEARLG